MTTALERFRGIARFERTNDPFLWSVAAWDEAVARWRREGMPVDPSDRHALHELLLGRENQTEYMRPFGAISAQYRFGELRWIVAVNPMFEPEILRQTDTHVVEVDFDGTIVERKKNSDASIPRYLEFPVKDKKTWDEYKKRLDPDTPARWPEGWEYMDSRYMNFKLPPELEGRHFRDRNFPLGMNLLSLYGNPRNYMGVENFSIAVYDDPLLVEEMIEWQAYMALQMARRVIEAGVVPDFVWVWEDMCFNKGPLISPKFVKEHMAPHYRKLADYLRGNGVEVLIWDCDGNIDELLPIVIESGINGTYPLECAAGMDARAVRKKFGKDIVLFGNLDKKALALGKTEIDRELDKAKELLAFGGYFPNADHHIPPDVSYENLLYFLKGLKALGK